MKKILSTIALFVMGVITLSAANIRVIQNDKMIRYVKDGDENINNATIMVEASATTISFVLEGSDKGLFALYNPLTAEKKSNLEVKTQQGVAVVELQYLGDFSGALGKTVNVKVTADGQTETLPKVVEDMPILTFLPAQSDYTVTHTNGTELSYKVTQNASAPTTTQVTEEGMLAVELSLAQTTNGEYAFVGWQEISQDENGNEIVKYISYEQNCVYKFNGSAQVRPEFIHYSVATFFIQSQQDKKIAYHDFALAIKDAEQLYKSTNTEQVVIFESIYTIRGYARPSSISEANAKIGTLASGDYIIPVGVTLLVPYSNAYKMQITQDNVLAEEYFIDGSNSFTLYRKLVVSDGTKIHIAGKINVAANINHNMNYGLGRPVNYGQIDLGANSHITTADNAVVYVMGYITGDYKNSSITISDGALVHEMLQIFDWRGGSASQSMLNNKNRVFLFNQYYIQNIETRLIIEYGGIECISTAANISIVGVVRGNADFIVPNNSNYVNGFFRLGEGATITKYYDASTDRLALIIEGKNNEIDDININLSSINMTTSNYVFPINNNMDIYGRSAEVKLLNDVALLAGAKLVLDAQSRLDINEGKKLILYDKNEHEVYLSTAVTHKPLFGSTTTYLPIGWYNYYSSYNSSLNPIISRPGTIYSRRNYEFETSDNGKLIPKESATIILDGIINGGVYTTQSGANILSNGGGKITLPNLSDTDTYQVLQHGEMGGILGIGATYVKYMNFSITSAKLQNSVGDPSVTTGGGTYVYDASQGKWIQDGTATPIVDNNDYTPTFTIATPSAISTYVGKTATSLANISTTNANVSWTDVTWSYQLYGPSANQFAAEFASDYSNATVTFAPTSSGSNKTATLKIIASYVKNQQLYTYEQEVALVAEALANTNNLDFTLSTITSAEGAQTLFSGGNGQAITIPNLDELAPFVTLAPINGGTNYTIVAKEGVNTVVTVQATQTASANVSQTSIAKIITVGNGREALPVTVNVAADNFDEATWAMSSEVTFNNGVVLPPHSQWTAFFSGTPDKVKFTPTTTTTWQVEEYDGYGWNVLYPWATIDANKEFALSLSPTASKVRIRSAKTTGTLQNVSITALTTVNVKANVDTLFIPIVSGDETITKSILLTYQSDELVRLSTSNSSLLTLDATVLDPAVDNYKQQVITLTSKMNVAGEYHISVRAGAVEKLIIPVIVYNVPQELPIMLKNDIDKYRYYYVTSNSNYAKWNASTREIHLKNVVGASSPSVTFAFEGAPTYISFDMQNAKGQCYIEYSVDGQSWQEATTATEKKTENNIEYLVNQNAQYIRVTYESLYAESVILSNLMIIGEPGLIVDPLQLELTKGETPLQQVTLTAINLDAKPSIEITEGFEYKEVSVTGEFAANKIATIKATVEYTGDKAVAYGSLTITYANGKTAVVELTGLAATLGIAETGIMTGVNPASYAIAGNFAYTYHSVNIANAYTMDGGNVKTLFDYVIIYGETKPASGTNVTLPTATSGSNAITPCFIYKANADQSAYELHKYVENVNQSNKVLLNETDVIPVDGSMKVYMTGFCPYASTGYTKASEGVWYFQGQEGETLDIYLEDCHIYSRNKTEDGHPFQSKQDGNSFTEGYVRGSGGVLVFECDELSNTSNPFKVNIHTRGDNVLKSNHGCFFDILGYRAYQVSSPVQIHMKDENYINGSATELTFDDLWPNTTALAGAPTRTNGYLALQKQVNNAPSIDMGNPNTVVNFKGGQVHLQNAQIVSTNYQTTLAICYRSGKMGGIEFPFACGIGTDDVGGTVKFYDGTTTVEPMVVDVKYRQYYLMDTDASGNELSTTSCLRTPTNTFIYGGSHCMIRACQHTTSKGGAPTDGNGNPLGLYQYPRNPQDGKKGGWTDGENGLVTPTTPPTNYNVESVTPNDNGTTDTSDDYLNFWVTKDYDTNVTPEVDKNTAFWAACMTKIEASMNSIGGSVGGETYIDQNTEVQNLLYCKIDEAIYDAITDVDYQAPVKIPSTTEYTKIPIGVQQVEGQDYVLQNYITNANNYTIEDKVYYVTTATADNWMTFTAPFDVQNIYVIESYSENELSKIQPKDGLTQRKTIMQAQAKHNADFAAFYGVAMALYSKSSIAFWDIFNDYIAWAKQQDARIQDENGNPIQQLYKGGTYDLRGKYALEHYNGSNYATAQYYLYENTADWTLSGDDDGVFETHWEFPDVSDGILMNQGQTYSILFPYCVGCGEGEKINDREYWDYWSGKFIIFESTDGQHIIKGANFVAAENLNADNDEGWIFENYDAEALSAELTGNSTFSLMQTDKSELYTYNSEYLSQETFYRNVDYDEITDDELSYTASILPTTAFLLATPPTNAQNMPARSISRTGKINYGKGNTPSGVQNGNIPTINGGSDIFVTTIANGINIAVAAPQLVRVLSSSGALLFNGWVESSVDVTIPGNGIFVVSGENTSLKVLH